VSGKKGPRKKPFPLKPVALVGVVAALVIVAFLLTRGGVSGPCGGATPLYVSSSIRGCVDFGNYTSYLNDLVNYVNCTGSKCIILFGLTNCPYCHAMHEFFTSNLGYRNIYRSLWLDVDENALHLFIELFKIEVKSGVDPGVAQGTPHILVVKNGEVRAIVVGLFEDESFWRSVVS